MRRNEKSRFVIEKVFKLENVEFHCHSIEASCGRRGKEFRAPECLKKQRRPINFSPAAKSAHTKRLSYAALEFLFLTFFLPSSAAKQN